MRSFKLEGNPIPRDEGPGCEYECEWPLEVVMGEEEEEDIVSVLDLNGEGKFMGLFGCPGPCDGADACEGNNEGRGSIGGWEPCITGGEDSGMGGVPVKNELLGDSDDEEVDRLCPWP